MIKQFVLSIFIFLCLSFNSLAQYDSVYYQGPAAGSVGSGVTVTLNMFTFDEPETGNKIADRIVEEPYFNPNPDGSEPAEFPGYVYVEDNSVPQLRQGNDPQTVILNKWDGIPMTNSIPPDPHLAVGPDHVIACVNSAFKVWDKEASPTPSQTVYQRFHSPAGSTLERVPSIDRSARHSELAATSSTSSRIFAAGYRGSLTKCS